jgi:MFS family permease
VNGRAATVLVRVAAFVQGLALVVIPTVSGVITDPHGLALSQSRYGALFLPQSLLAIAFSLGGAALKTHLGVRATLLIGFAADAVAMGLIASTALLVHDQHVAYALLLCATGALGIGFSIVTPTLNVLAGSLDQRHADRSVLIVNALLGGSAALAPLLLIAFVGLGWWWGLPAICALGMLALIAAVSRISFGTATAAATKPQRSRGLPARVWLFATFAFAYGLCEQINGSWAPLYVSHHLGAAASFGSLALAVFWGVATAGRVFFAVTSAKLKPAIVFGALPFVLAAAFAVLATLPAHAPPWSGVLAFAFAGLGISALLPLSLSLCEDEMPAVATTATSVVFSLYLVGYGLAAFGAGPLQQRGITIPTMDAWSIAIALVAGFLAITIVRTAGANA